MVDPYRVSVEGRTIGAVEKTMVLLEELKRRNGATLSELSEALDMSHSSVHHYLLTLRKYGYVVKDGTTYDVSVRFLTLGGYARRRHDLDQISKEKVGELAADTGKTTRLIVENEGTGITFYQETPTGVSETHTYEGFEEDLYATAAGKAILAELPTERVDQIIDHGGLEAHTENTITDREELDAELARIREQDYAVDDEECFEGVICLASAITTPDGVVLGAISVSSPTADVDREAFVAENRPKVQNATGVIEINHTYSSWQTV